MARLTAEQWERARADYEIGGLTQREVAEKYKVSPGAVGNKASRDKWSSGKCEQAKTDKAKAIIKIADIEQETEQKLSKTEQAVFDIAVADDVEFRLRNDEDMEKVRNKAMELLTAVDTATGVKGIMETLRIQREAKLGKLPDMLITAKGDVTVERQPLSEIFQK